MIRTLIVILVVLLIPFGAKAQNDASIAKLLKSNNPFLPLKTRILHYEEREDGSSFSTKRFYLKKSNTGSTVSFVETGPHKEGTGPDTVKYYELGSSSFKGFLIDGVVLEGNRYGFSGYIPTRVDTVYFKKFHFILEQNAYYQPYVMVGANRFDHILYVQTKVIKRIRIPGQGFKDVITETQDSFYAFKIGLVARTISDVEGNIFYSLTLTHPEKGKWVEHREDGSVSHKMKYKKGERHGKYESWHSEGYKKETLKYVKGNLHKKQIQYYQTGIKKSVHLYKHGKLEGLFMWHKNKTLAQTGLYKAGKRNGAWVKWDNNGEVIGKATYELGKVVEGYWPMPED